MFQCGSAADVHVDDGTATAPIAIAEPIQPNSYGTVLDRQYRDLSAEVEAINAEVTNVRKQLWEAQDALKNKDDTIRKLEAGIHVIADKRKEDESVIKELQTANADLVEEEAKVRESLDLMKKVLTRSELRAKEDEETMTLLKEERDSLLQVSGVSDKKSNVNLTAIERIKEVSAEREAKYKELLNDAEAEIEEWKQRHASTAKLVNNLRAQLAASEDPSGAAQRLEEQRRMIDALEEQIIELEMEELEKEEERRNEKSGEYDHSVIHRSLLDEDMQGSKLRVVMDKLDCRQ
ncbi:MAG: hypothetical protein SGILL_001806 [Bacillariaceae sp.]